MSTGAGAEKTLFDVLGDAWRAKVYMFVFGAAGFICALAFLFLARPHYRAEMVVAPAHPFVQSISSPSQIGEGAIQVQGQDLSGSASFVRFEQIIRGAGLAAALLNDSKVLEGLIDDQRFVFSKPMGGWSAEKLSEYLKRRVHVEPVSGTGLRRIVYYHVNADFAVYFIARLHELSDGQIRRDILLQTNERIAYLNEALGKVLNPEHKRSLAVLLMEQERMKMLVSLDQPFAATVIEPAFVSSRPRWPDPFLIYSVFVFLGLVAGFVVHGLRRGG